MISPHRPADTELAPAGLATETVLTWLENGLTVIVREDHSAPVVSTQAWCMSGSIHEGEWLGAGISHVLEHMLFKGTATRPGSRIDQEVQEAGGYMNAYTSFDRTVYHIDVPNTGTRVALDILCDIMQNAALPVDELEKEKQVIVREMDMNVDDPARRASRRLFETAYTRSPYRFTVIGYRDIFDRLKPENILAYYRGHYVPNNIFFVVVGDVKSQEVIQQIRDSFAKARSKPLPAIALPEEPRQTGPREVIEEAPIELGYLHFAWHIPELRHPDVPLLDVLAAVLGNGRSSRLFQRVREKKGFVTSVDAWTYSPGNPGLFGISAVVEPDKFERAREALAAEVDMLHRDGVEPAELSKTIKQFVSATLACRKTMQGQAQDLGSNWIAANDLGFSERYLEAVRKVTPADLARVARTYLTLNNRTFFALLPTGTAPKATILSAGVEEHPIQKFEFPNGLRLLVKESHRLPFIEFRAVFKGGVLAEQPANNGLTQLGGRMLLKGTTRRSAEELALAVESVGGSIDSYGGNNSFGVNLELLSSETGLGIDLLSELLLHPSFPQSELEREREVQLASIRAQKDHLLQVALKSMRRALFGEIGYGLDTLGSEPAVQNLQVQELRDWHRGFAVPGNCVLAIYGDVKPEQIREAVGQALGAWTGKGGDLGGKGVPSGGQKRVRTDADKKQAVVVIGYPGTTVHAEDRYALELLQEACSDLGSRLFLRIRETLGLAYYVGAQNFVGLSPGYFAFYAGTMPEQADLVERELLAEAELLRLDGLTAEELKRAKAKVIGQKKIARQDLGTLAISTALDELYGLGYAHTDAEDALYEAVTLEQVKAVAQKHLRPEDMVVSHVAPPLPAT